MASHFLRISTSKKFNHKDLNLDKTLSISGIFFHVFYTQKLQGKGHCFTGIVSHKFAAKTMAKLIANCVQLHQVLDSSYSTFLRPIKTFHGTLSAKTCQNTFYYNKNLLSSFQVKKNKLKGKKRTLHNRRYATACFGHNRVYADNLSLNMCYV